MRPPLTPARYTSYWLIGLVGLAIAVAICLYVGPDQRHWMGFGYPRTDDPDIPAWIVWRIRTLRVISAGLCGWALAASGVALQALLRNALADPYVVGISSGGALGVMVYLLATYAVRSNPAMNDAWISTLLQAGSTLPATAGAAVTCVVVYVIARSRSGGEMDPLTLLLVGVVIAAVNGALIMLLNNFAPGGAVKDLMRYMMGRVAEDWSGTGLAWAAGLLALGWLPLVLTSKALNVSTLSDVEVAALGVRIGVLRTLTFFCAALMTAVSIALAGPIGFIGLICPHICRALFGPDHRQLIVTAPFCGAILLMLADSFVRSTPLVFNGELPVGVITALAGGPFFLMILSKRTRAGGGDVG